MTDKEFVAGIRNHDQDVFRKFVDNYQVMVRNTCYAFVHNTEDAEDLAQEVFIEAFQSIHRFRSDSKLSTWLYRIAMNKSLNYLRYNKTFKAEKKIEDNIQSTEYSKYQSDTNSSIHPTYNIDKQERKAVLRKAMKSLTHNQKITFILNKYENLSYKDIAEVMNISLASVESSIHRAKLVLQKKLINYYKNETERK